MSFSAISTQYPLILASASPRRKRLLTQIGLPFRSVASQVTEDDQTVDPTRASLFLAEKKARQVYSSTRDYWILGADTVVSIDSDILGKPKDKEEARRMLFLLSGKKHRVITGFCILNPSGKPAYSEAITTTVRIKKLTEQEIDAYIATAEPYGKAGSYAIQGIGSFMVESISGSYTNVVGLPLCALIKALILVGALQCFPLPGDL
jgi:septum formation protein